MITKTFLMGAIVAALAAAGASEARAQRLGVTATGTKTVKLNDKVGQNQFRWTSDAPLEKIQGTAEGVSGSFTIDPANPAGIRGTISAKVSTMKTGNATRDKHLQGADWLDAANHPTISFTITSIKNISVNGIKMTATAVGNFTMHGVTKQMSIPFTLTYMDESAKTRERAAGDLVMIEANFTVSLSDFNVKGTKGTIGSKVGQTITVNAKLFGATG